jgi:hypothetical protein
MEISFRNCNSKLSPISCCYGGKASHSGAAYKLHIALLYIFSAKENKTATNFDVYSSLLQPQGFQQLETTDYNKIIYW